MVNSNLYRRVGIDVCPKHGQFMRPMSKEEWQQHVDRKHAGEEQQAFDLRRRMLTRTH